MTSSSDESADPQAAAWRQLQAFNQRLLVGRSATGVLEQWCGGPDGTRRIHVLKRVVPARAIPPALLAKLAGRGDEAVAYRSVALVYAGVTVSEAENWYYPSRVGAAMQQALEYSDRAFGSVVNALDFARETLCIDWLWQPGQYAQAELPWALLRHQAILQRADGLPFSAVIETYTRALLSFGGARGGD